MSRRFHFSREEIAAELQRCGYPLTTDEEVERFERDLVALYAEANFGDDSGVNYSLNDNFYDLPPPLRDDIDFSKYYTTTSKSSASSDNLLIEKSGTSDKPAAIKNLIKKPPKLVPIRTTSTSAPASGRGKISSPNANDISIASTTNSTKRKVLRKSDDGSSYIDELMFGRPLPALPKTKLGKLPLVVDRQADDQVDDDDFEGMPPLDYDYQFGETSHTGPQIPIEDKISRLTLISERAGSADSPIMRRSIEARNARKASQQNGRDEDSPLRLSDRDNRQLSGGKTKTGSIAGSVSGGSMLPSVIARPMHVNTGKAKRVVGQDPVTRYAEYSKAWRSQKAPGEKQHKELRWQIRGQMLARDDTIFIGGRRTVASNANVVPQRPVSRPNNYVVPTEKKRQALRWAIRSALANGRQPPTSTRYVNRAFMSG